MEFLKTVGIIVLIIWALGFIFKIGRKILKFFLILGLIMLVIGFLS